MVSINLEKNGVKRHIPHVPIDQVMLEERAASFTKRSIKSTSKLDALKLIISMIDLTTLEGADTAGKVIQLCQKAVRPVSDLQLGNFDPKKIGEIPSVAAVCVYPEMIPTAVERLKGTGINIASVATAFPSGQFPLDLKLKDVKDCIDKGANEIDMVISRGDFLAGRYQKVFDEIRAVKDVCGDEAHLKVILETGELKTYDKVRLASWIAMEAGADFIKTSTGKVSPGATMPVTLLMLQAIDDYYHETGKIIGMKPAGGIRTAKQAIHYLCLVNETLGPKWLDPDLFRFGASSLLNDVLRQIFKQVSGEYYYTFPFAID